MIGQSGGAAGAWPEEFRLTAAEWDALADYTGGALDGTPEAARIEHQITDDPRWAAAYAALSGAADTVRTELAGLGALPEPMPADIAGRLDAALAEAADPAATPAPPRLSQRRGTAGPGRESSRGTGPAGRGSRRRWPRWATPVTVAAGVLALAGLGGGLLANRPGGLPGTSSQDAGTAAQAPPADSPLSAEGGAAAPQPSPMIVNTGIDYRRDTVTAIAPSARTKRDTATDAGTHRPGLDTAPNANDPAVPAALRRLTVASALADCLQAVRQARSLPSAPVTVVDFARFEGSPALIVVLARPGGGTAVSVAGPDCGLPGRGAAELFAG